MNSTFFARRSLLVLLIVFFLVPFAMRGARLSLRSMKNDIKDWLPSDFKETSELDWFRDHFAGEQFVICSWEGCQAPISFDPVKAVDDAENAIEIGKGYELKTGSKVKYRRSGSDDIAGLADGTTYYAVANPEHPHRVQLAASKDEAEADTPTVIDLYHGNATGLHHLLTADDERLQLFIEKLRAEDTPIPGMDEKQRDKLVGLEEFVGRHYGLFWPEYDYHDWGGLDEKWLQGRNDAWYYITPDGKLYRWTGQSTLLGLAKRKALRLLSGKSVDGELVEQLHPIDHQRPYRIEARLFKTVTTGPQVLDQMTRDGGPLRRGSGGDRSEAEAREIALQRLKGTLFGPHGRQTCVIVTLTDAAKEKLQRVVGRGLPGHPRGSLVRLAKAAGINPPPRPPMFAIPSLGLGIPAEPPSPSLKMGGPPVDNVAIDEEGQITLVRLVGLCGLLGFTLSYLSFRSIKITIMLFFVGGVGAIGSLGAVWWLGSSVDAVLMSMPAVVYVLGLSGAVHIVNYYRDAIEEHGTADGAPERAVAHGWLPCTLAAVTTAMGLASLCTSELKPIWKFGAFSALGVLGTLVLLFTYLPAALQTWPPNFRLSDLRTPSPFAQRFTRWADAISGGIIRHNVVVALACTLVLIVGGWGLMSLHTSVHLIKMFDSQSRIISDYRWLENHLGKLVPMELVLRFDPRLIRNTNDEEQPATAAADGEPVPQKRTVHPQMKYSMLDRMDAAARVQRVIEQWFGEGGNGVVGRGMSVATFAPDLPEAGGGFRQAIYRNTFSRRIEEHRQEFVDSDYLRDDKDDQAELWRVSIRLAALKDIDYGAFVSDLKRAVEPVMAAYRYRDQILKQIIDDHDGEGLDGASVLVIGAPYKKYADLARQAAEAAETTTGDASSVEEMVEADFGSTFAHQEVDQTQIFAVALKDLLRNARLRLDVHDPTQDSPEALQDQLADTDYVILVADDASYDLAAIRKQLPEGVIDVREHQYDPATAANGASILDLDEASTPSVSTIYTGVVPVVYKAQRTLLNNLIQSIALAFVMIAFVMMFVLRSPTAALISMMPNVFPVVVIFGAMGWLRINVDIGTMMTASVAMGVAVDDTIHFLTWYRWGLDKGYSRKESIQEAYRRVGKAMLQTTAIGGLGMAVFALSTFTPTQRFGVLMLTLLTAALVGDLVFLPALLAGPFGKLFSPSSKDRKKREQAGSPGSEPDASPNRSEPLQPADTEETDVVTPPEPAAADPRQTPVEAAEPSADLPHMKGKAEPTKRNPFIRHDAPHNLRQK